MKKVRLMCLMVAGFFLLLALIMPVSADLTKIKPGGVVFIGEQGLDISSAVGDYHTLAWWPSGSSVSSNPPAQVIDISSMNKNSFYIDPSLFSYTGSWYAYNDVQPSSSTTPAFILEDPRIGIKIWDLDTNLDSSGRSVLQGDPLSFRIDTNLYKALDPSYRQNINSATDGIITIKVKTDGGVLLDSLYDTSSTTHTLVNQYVDTQSWTWGGSTVTSWGTGSMDSQNQYRYPVGTYVVWAESTLNNMKNNYKNGGSAYTGKTVSQSTIVSLVTPAVRIESNKDSVTRGNSFYVVITGKPTSTYYLWVQGTGGMTGVSQNQPPMITLNQQGVTMDPEAGPFTIGSYAYTQGAGKTIRDDIPPSVSGAPNTRYYAQILMSTYGTRTVEFQTSSDTKPGTYSLKVESGALSDTVPVVVQKGGVTITSDGNQVYNLGDTIHFSGTNTETAQVYLFLENYAPGGKLSSPPTVVTNSNAATFDSATVLGDTTWSYNWQTSGLNLPNGTYTVYAVSLPYDRNNLAGAAYGSLSIFVNSPITATTTIPTTTTTANVTTTVTTATTVTTITTGTPLTTVPATLTRTISPVKTTKQPLTRGTTSKTTASATNSPLPDTIACAALVIGAVTVLWRKK